MRRLTTFLFLLALLIVVLVAMPTARVGHNPPRARAEAVSCSGKIFWSAGGFNSWDAGFADHITRVRIGTRHCTGAHTRAPVYIRGYFADVGGPARCGPVSYYRFNFPSIGGVDKPPFKVFCGDKPSARVTLTLNGASQIGPGCRTVHITQVIPFAFDPDKNKRICF